MPLDLNPGPHINASGQDRGAYQGGENLPCEYTGLHCCQAATLLVTVRTGVRTGVRWHAGVWWGVVLVTLLGVVESASASEEAGAVAAAGAGTPPCPGGAPCPSGTPKGTMGLRKPPPGVVGAAPGGGITSTG